MPRTSNEPRPISAESRTILFLTVFIHLLGFGIIIPLLPYYAETYGATGLTVGLLTTSFSFSQFVFAPFWGRLSDRVGRRPILIGSLLLTGVSYLVYAAAGSLALLFASRILAGVAGAVLSTAQAYVADTTTPENRTKGMGLIGAAFGMGFIFGPAIGGLLSRWGFAAPAYASASLALAAAVFAFLRLPESLPREARAGAAARRSRTTLREALARPAVGTVLGLFFVATLCFSGMETILALFCQRFYGWGPHEIGYLFAYVGVVAASMQLGIVGALARRFGERALVRAGLALMGAAFVTAGLVPPLALFLLVMGAIAVASGLMTPSLSGLISIATPADEQGGILGVYQSLGSLARAAGPFLGGLAFDVVSPGAPLWMAGIGLGLAALFAAKLPHRSAPTDRSTS
ncbi:MAG: MFS transporter [Candidatus Eisenbacteria bacterium]|uniref:MFS transporter n=1 Tax=Eiseniibacteriota bacterium TaxID=2212470 RepID=A0A538SQ61_UNCEI|nr:MAG: MFS transporter [Candidatus Eisenbacteria bacterium]